MTKQLTCRRRANRQRGSVLVLVLGVTSIVGVIGLSSLLAVRLQHRDVQTRADASQAQQLADTGLQLLHARLSANNNWRNEHTHDAWSADESLGDGSQLRYKLRDEGDENDADLADDENDAARLIVRVAHGNAVRLASCQLAGGETLGPELISNGDMEAGSANYATTSLLGNINGHSDSPHSGSTYLQLENRLTALDGWKQDLTPGAIESGKTYRVSVWVRLENADADVVLGIFNGLLLLSDTEDQQAAATTDWQHLQFDLTPNFSFNPTSTYVFGRTATGNQDIHLDDLSLREVPDTGDPIPVVRGSYRRELDN